MSLLPPPLSAASNERMFDVLDRAGTAVDAGAHPDAALAKAAAECALPPGHVPVLVRAFNTGRAARQLAEGSDAWSKAADHPVADAQKVAAMMGGPPPRGPALGDYGAPPRAQTKAAAAPSLGPVPEYVKRAFEAPPAPPARVNRLDLEYRAAAAFDRAAEELARLAPAKYAAAKAAAAHYAPEAAAYVFGRLEAEDAYVAVKAARAKDVRMDPAFPADHPAVLAVLEIGRVKAAYAPPPAAPEPPAGWGDSARYPGFWEPLPVCPILKQPILPAPAKAAAEAPKPADPFAFIAAVPQVKEGASGKDQAPGSGGFLGAALGGFGKSLNFGGRLAFGKDGDGGILSGLKVPESPKGPSSTPAFLDRTRHDLERVQSQAAIQDLMTDPRFARADPSQVLDAYRQFAQVAPLAMQNRAIAGDMVHRRLMTGPLGTFDMKSLTDIEHNLARIGRVRRGDDDED